jgi:hypothetical protein
MMRRRSAVLRPAQLAISFNVRPQPEHSFVPGSMTQTRLQGVSKGVSEPHCETAAKRPLPDPVDCGLLDDAVIRLQIARVI